MSNFTKEEIEDLQRIGNKGSRETVLARWNPQEVSLPPPHDEKKIEKFIQYAFVKKHWAKKDDVLFPSALSPFSLLFAELLCISCLLLSLFKNLLVITFLRLRFEIAFILFFSYARDGH